MNRIPALENAMAQRPEHRGAGRRLARQPRPPASEGAACQEAALQALPLDDHLPAGTASAVGTAGLQELT